ncbi:MAG: phosphoserine transaminase [Clostridiales bacterium]
MKPVIKTNNPNFSSGPCSKIPEFRLELLKDAPIGRSHRSKIGKEKLKKSIDMTKEILKIPKDYLVAIVPASDTGAIEMAMWNVLGQRGVDVLYFESFGNAWANDIKNQLKLDNVNYIFSEYGELPNFNMADFNNDVVFTWNGTTSGVKIPNGEWISDNRKGLTISDATSAVFAMDIPWKKLDVTTFSWQKCLGGEAAHGMLVLSPRAVERIENYTPNWPIPKIFQLKKKGKINLSIFEGSTINTPSMICNEDYLVTLKWAESIGGLDGLIKRSKDNLNILEKYVEENDWIDFLCKNKEYRSNTSVCFKLNLEDEKIENLIKLLEKENVAYDCKSYRDAPKGLRFWCGPTIEKEDLEKLLPWLTWAYNEVQNER